MGTLINWMPSFAVALRLESAGFTELDETASWQLAAGRVAAAVQPGAGHVGGFQGAIESGLLVQRGVDDHHYFI